MQGEDAVERALSAAFDTIAGAAKAEGRAMPPRLRAAMYDALFPGGARLRPRLVLEVAKACGAASTGPAEAAAAAVEMVHCASLVHDDLPCFDDATIRRGRSTVHHQHGEALAILVGDGLIVAAFETLVRGFASRPELITAAVACMSAGLGPRTGLVAGQAWESENDVDLVAYHRAKTAALFETAVRLGALAADGKPQAWAPVGLRLGEAFQVMDDLRDATAASTELGKPVRRDAVLGRPNAALELGVGGARARLCALEASIHDAVPACPGRHAFRGWLVQECGRLFPARDVEPSSFMVLPAASA